MKKLTIFTPTYNRRALLRRAYESLVRQTSRDFVWLIIDDGSTDGTSDDAAAWIEKADFEIKYVYKHNAGKHTAANVAFEIVSTPLLMISLDSDDVLTPDAVQTVIDCYESEPGSAGYVFMKSDMSNKPLCAMSDALQKEVWRDAVMSGAFSGECVLVMKSEYIKRFSYPVIDGEKFFTEGYLYLLFDEKLSWYKKTICKAEYQPDGYSARIMDSFRANPVSYAMYNELRIRYGRMPLAKLKYAMYYDAFSIKAAKKHFIKDSPAPFLCAVMLPAGALFRIALK